MTDWVRLWHDMPTDPKWRVIARKSGQPIAAVMAVFNFVLVSASANSEERGTMRGFDCEDVAAALDMEPSDIAAIVASMQGKVLDGDRLTAWEKRQPKREDSSSDRVRSFRERNANKHTETQCNATETQCNAPETETETETEEESSTKPARRRISYPPEFEAVWKAYPTDSLMSKSEALKAWRHLDESGRDMLDKSIPAFVAHCRANPDYRPVHLCRFISQGRFEGFAKQSSMPARDWRKDPNLQGVL